ncbi:hypothetical protein VTO73DRAFT_3562 [Trametes versicolor]
MYTEVYKHSPTPHELRLRWVFSWVDALTRKWAFHVKSLLHSAYKHKPIIHPGISSKPARPLAPDSVQKDEKIQGRMFKTSTTQHEQKICISSQSAPSPLEAVGPSVRGFMLCIAACPLRGVQPCPSP